MNSKWFVIKDNSDALDLLQYILDTVSNDLSVVVKTEKDSDSVFVDCFKWMPEASFNYLPGDAEDYEI